MNALKESDEKYLKKVAEKFAGSNFCRTFAIPKQKKRWW